MAIGLIEQLIKKKLELSEEASLEKRYIRGMWHFYVAYNLAIRYMGVKPLDPKKKNMLWKRFLLNPEMEDSKTFKKLQEYISTDTKAIMDAIDTINEEKGREGGYFGDIYQPFTVAVVAFEYSEEE